MPAFLTAEKLLFKNVTKFNMVAKKLKLHGLIFALLLPLSFANAQPITKTAAAPGQEKTIKFIENSWAAALKTAAAKNKYIFVDAYTTWCGPCKMLKATTFKSAAAATFFNENFVNAALDMEKSDGVKLSSEWEIQAYPTLLIVDAKGKIIRKAEGFMQADELIRFGQSAIDQKGQ